MDWKNARKGHVPENGQEVLIAVNDTKYVAVFDLVGSLFRVVGNPTILFQIKDTVVYWTEIKKPGRNL